MSELETTEEVTTEAPVERKELIAEVLSGNVEIPEEQIAEPEEEEFSQEVKLGDKVPTKKAAAEDIPILPPADLDAEEKKDFEALPPRLKQKFTKRFYDMRRDYTQKTMELAQQRQKYQAIEQESSKHANRLARKGVNVEQAISNALAWDQFVEEQGANGALQWLEKHGYDPEELIEARDSGQAYSGRQQQAQIPTEIQRELEAARQFRQQIERQRHEHVLNSTFTSIEQFKAAKPVFKDPSTAEQIEAAMTPVVQGLRHANPRASHGELLERAYNYVINGDERFKNLVQGAEKRKHIEAERDRSHRATRAASSVAGTGPGSGSPSSVPKDRRSLIAAALDGRVTI